MNDIVIIWDDEDDRDGNYWHICVEGHGLTREEIEEVLLDEESEIEVSRSSGRPTAFGWTSSGERIAVVLRKCPKTRKSFTPFPPTRCRRSEPREGKSDERQINRQAEMERGRSRPAQGRSGGIRALPHPGGVGGERRL